METLVPGLRPSVTVCPCCKAPREIVQTRVVAMMDDVSMNIRNDLMEPPDPKPSIPCHECGEHRPYKEYWKPRYVDPEDVDPHESTWLCDDCKSVVRRAEENERLDEYTTS